MPVSTKQHLTFFVLEKRNTLLKQVKFNRNCKNLCISRRTVALRSSHVNYLSEIGCNHYSYIGNCDITKNRNKIGAVFNVFNKFHAATASLEKPCFIGETRFLRV